MKMWTYPDGVYHLPGELSHEHVTEIIEQLPGDLSTKQPDFNDETGNSGYLVWKKRDGLNIPDFATEALSGLHRIAVKAEALRVIQINCQQPHGEQKLHTDAPFSSSLTFHLSPGGLFEYKTLGKDDLYPIPLHPGDVVALTHANETLHRGRNTSHLGRYTLTIFFNGKAFSI